MKSIAHEKRANHILQLEKQKHLELIDRLAAFEKWATIAFKRLSEAEETIRMREERLRQADSIISKPIDHLAKLQRRVAEQIVINIKLKNELTLAECQVKTNLATRNEGLRRASITTEELERRLSDADIQLRQREKDLDIVLNCSVSGSSQTSKTNNNNEAPKPASKKQEV